MSYNSYLKTLSQSRWVKTKYELHKQVFMRLKRLLIRHCFKISCKNAAQEPSKDHNLIQHWAEQILEQPKKKQCTISNQENFMGESDSIDKGYVHY